MKTQQDTRRHSGLSEFSAYFVPDELDEIEMEIDRQKVLADYRSREN
jgi:hypothetical protein